jgi:four helix bundle protein
MESWKIGRTLARRIYSLTETGTWGRDYALRDQIRRAAISIMSNIAEGFESHSDQQFARYLAYAKGSAGELRAQLYVAFDVGYLDEPTFCDLRALAERCSRQVSGLMTYLQTSQQRHHVRDNGDLTNTVPEAGIEDVATG